MLAIGMVASFLTANLTVAFVLGVAFNAPIALLPESDWGIAQLSRFQSRDYKPFRKAFFVGVALQCFIFAQSIGRRHWVGSQRLYKSTIIRPSSCNSLITFGLLSFSL